MNVLRNRGVEDTLISCVDGLTGFPQAIEAVFPQTEIQQCLIHQIRNTTKFVSYKEIKPLMANLKRVYALQQKKLIIPGLFEPPVRTLRATIPENESHIFR